MLEFATWCREGVEGWKLLNFTVTPGVVVLAVQKAVIGTKTGSATFVRKIVAGTTIRVRISGKTLTTYKFLGN